MRTIESARFLIGGDMNISTATEHTEPNMWWPQSRSIYIGCHTPSDMSADEIADNERASMIEAGSWNFRYHGFYYYYYYYYYRSAGVTLLKAYVPHAAQAFAAMASRLHRLSRTNLSKANSYNVQKAI